MSFLLRQISHTGDGREIVRTRTLDGDRVTVGRSATSDIALADLAVSPDHAVIERTDDRRLSVVAVGTLGFAVDGRTTLRATIDSAKGGEIALGTHRITVSREPDGQIALTVAQVEAAAAHDDTGAFSLRGLLPGKRPTAWLLVVAILVGFLAVPIWGFLHREDERSIYALHTDKSWSSGPLSAAHHALEGKCEACHQQAFVSVRDTSCRACHKDAHDHAAPDRIARARAAPGAGGQILATVSHAFGKPGAGACVDCHTEHKGAGPMPPTPQAFCADCHAALDRRLTDTKIGNAADFGTLHPQFRPLVATTAGTKPILARVSLDADPRDASGLKFPHKLHLDARGGVARMAQTLGKQGALACADCHTPSADGTRFLPVSMERNCQSCHSLAYDRVGGTLRTLRHGDTAQMIADLRAMYRSTGPVRPPELGGMARRQPGLYAQGQLYHAYFGAVAARPADGEAAVRAVFSTGGACFDCHTATPPGVNGAADWTVTPVRQPTRYMQHGWFDHAAHRTETCASCHSGAKTSMRSEDVLLPGIKTCRTCHGGATSAAKVPSNCALCHSYHIGDGAPWTPRDPLTASRQPQQSAWIRSAGE